MGNIYPKIKKGKKDKLPKDIKEGQILATTDTFEIFVDIEKTRIQLSTQKAGSTDYVKWDDVSKDALGFSAAAPFGSIPYIDKNGYTTLGKKLSFYPSDTLGDPVQTIVCDDDGFKISGVTEGNFKGNLDGTAKKSKKIVDSDNIDSEIGVSYNKAELGLTDITYLAAWKDGEIRKILANNFIEDITIGDNYPILTRMVYKFTNVFDAWDETWCWSLINTNEGNSTFTAKDIEEEGQFPTYYSNHNSIFIAYVEGYAAGETTWGTSDQIKVWLIWFCYYGSSSSKVGVWKKVDLASWNNRKNADGTVAGWRFAFVSVDDYERFGIKVYKGSGVTVKYWQLH